MKDLGRKLFCLRTLHGYTQVHVAKQIGVSATIYVGIEKNASSIPVSRLGSIAALYGLSLEHLFSFSEKDLMDLIKGRVPAIMQDQYLPQLLSKVDAMNKLLWQLVQHTFSMTQKNRGKPD